MDNRKLVVLLSGIALVLAMVLVAMVLADAGDGKAAGPAAVPAAGSTVATAPTAHPGMAPSTGTAFDEKTATRARGNSPAKHVARYYEDLRSGDYAEAFKLQPAASRAGGDARSFGETQKAYGMVSYTVAEPVVSGDAASVTVSQDLGSNGKWTVTWSFRRAGGTWYVESRRVSMDTVPAK